VELSDQQVERYSRHLILEEVGLGGQIKLLESRVLIIGAGGLGAPAALYLAAAGVGTIGLVDGDRVDLTNLQRQVIHHTPDVGVAKVTSAASKMRSINPDIRVVEHPLRATAENVLALVGDYDFVIDGTDNFGSKFLINDACYLAKKPLSHAGILRFDGQLMTIVPGQSACYRCVFEAPPPGGAVPSCAQAGVLGVVAGVIGCLQATEALKFLLGREGLLTNALLTWDASRMEFRKLKLRQNPRCALCGPNATITRLEEPPPETCELGRG
jgi:molybdopterin-synthase adenylyltransferase